MHNFESENLENKINDILSKIKTIYPNIVKTEWRAEIGTVKIFNFDELQNCLNIELIKYTEENQIKKMKKQDFLDFLDYLYIDFKFIMTFYTDSPILAKIAHKKFLKISKIKQLNHSISMIIPNIGYYQGYYQGETDTWNYNSFLK